MIHLGLILAADLERDGFVEAPCCWAAVEADEVLACNLEGDDHGGSGFLTVNLLAAFGVSLGVGELRVWEDGSVEVCGLLRLVVEPEAGCDLAKRRHDVKMRRMVLSECFV